MLAILRSRSASSFRRSAASTGPTLVLALALLSAFASSVSAKLNIVVTTPDLASIAKEIGGDALEITTLVRPTEDAHFIDPKPSFMVKLNRADGLIEGGAELESGWLGPLVQGSRNSRLAVGSPGRIQCNAGINMLEVPATLSRDQGDIHAAGNPHYVIAPSNALKVADTITAGLSALDGAHAEEYRQRLKAFRARLEAKQAEWRKALEPFRGRHVVSYHNSWPYFAAEYDLKFELFIEPKPGIPPSPAHLAALVGQMKEKSARVILVEPSLGRKAAETLVRSTGATLVPASQFPGGVKGTEEGYVQLLDYLVSSLARALAP